METLAIINNILHPNSLPEEISLKTVCDDAEGTAKIAWCKEKAVGECKTGKTIVSIENLGPLGEFGFAWIECLGCKTRRLGLYLRKKIATLKRPKNSE